MGFFDKIKEQASGLGAQLDGAIKGTKGSGQLSTLNKQREDLAKQLGNMVLDQFRAGALDEAALRGTAEQVFEVERQIIQTQQEIEAQKEAAAAARGHRPAAARRRHRRPRRLRPRLPPRRQPPPRPRPRLPPRAAGAVCPNCNTPVAEGAAFCPECGNRF